jgi:hypothetical protein
MHAGDLHAQIDPRPCQALIDQQAAQQAAAQQALQAPIP